MGWQGGTPEEQWKRLAELIRERDPKKIGINVSRTWAFADGLSASLEARLREALGPELSERLTGAEKLVIRWLETRLPDERDTYAEAARIAHDILRRGLSREAVTPGTTTPEDLEWWYRQTVHDAGLGSWFHPTVTAQRASDDPVVAIEPGDLVHVDFGVVYASLCTDQQEHAYVLRTGETEAPAGLRDGLSAASRIQDLLLERYRLGATGNDILRDALEDCAAAGLEATIYSHAIGLHGHGAGLTVGLWDMQDGVPGSGDHPLHRDTAHSIELMGVSTVPEWGDKRVRFMLEQDAWFDGERCSWLDGRQTDLHLI